jgi:hypothetical protein
VAYDQPVGPKLNAFRAVSSTPTAVASGPRAPAPAVVAAAPNPITGSGEIRFALPAAGRARLLLFDAAGRRVRELADAVFGAGPHAARWDGRDDRGHPVASGVYFARLESGGVLVKSKVVLIRP